MLVALGPLPVRRLRRTPTQMIITSVRSLPTDRSCTFGDPIEISDDEDVIIVGEDPPGTVRPLSCPAPLVGNSRTIRGSSLNDASSTTPSSSRSTKAVSINLSEKLLSAAPRTLSQKVQAFVQQGETVEKLGKSSTRSISPPFGTKLRKKLRSSTKPLPASNGVAAPPLVPSQENDEGKAPVALCDERLSWQEFEQSSFNEVVSLSFRRPLGFLADISMDDICAKALNELKKPANIKRTPRRYPAIEFKAPVSFENQTIVISDEEGQPTEDAYADLRSQLRIQRLRVEKVVKTEVEAGPQTAGRIINVSEEKKHFMESLNLTNSFTHKRARKRDIVAVLRTPRIVKQYILNPLVDIRKAMCIFKYGISKEKIKLDQFKIKPLQKRGRHSAPKIGPKKKKHTTQQQSNTNTAAIPDSSKSESRVS